MANKNDQRQRGGQNYQSDNTYPNRNQMGYSGQPGQGQHSAYQDNRGQFSGQYGAEGHYPGSQQHGGFDTLGNVRGNEGGRNISYDESMRGDYAYGPNSSNYENPARYDNQQRAYGRSQTYGGPQSSWDEANAGWRGAPQNADRGFQFGYPQGGYGYDQSNYGQHQHQHMHDPEYCQWRQEQIRSLDDSYSAWRDERYSKFAKDFGEWRKNRKESAAEGNTGEQRSQSSESTKSK